MIGIIMLGSVDGCGQRVREVCRSQTSDSDFAAEPATDKDGNNQHDRSS